MLKIEITPGKEPNSKVARIEALGSMVDMLSDLCHAINEIYSAYAKKSPADGERFKEALLLGLLIPSSPAWSISETAEGSITTMRIPKGGTPT